MVARSTRSGVQEIFNGSNKAVVKETDAKHTTSNFRLVGDCPPNSTQKSAAIKRILDNRLDQGMEMDISRSAATWHMHLVD